jgi:hypothetical protein
MDDREDQKAPKQGIPEALHPGIGNGSAWETDPHFLALRTVDPLTDLDPFLLDGDERSSILLKWKSLSEEESSLQGEASDQAIFHAPVSEHGTEDIPERDKKKKKKHKNSREPFTTPEWIDPDHLILKEDPNKLSESSENQIIDKTPAKPEGKRVKKALKKAKKEELKISSEMKHVTNTKYDAGLSPFTSWLKGLRGSEYVHPYEDDYALGQQGDPREAGISETFADLLVAQGFREKAIEMYGLLMTKYPEKSSFFAAKIEALK